MSKYNGRTDAHQFIKEPFFGSSTKKSTGKNQSKQGKIQKKMSLTSQFALKNETKNAEIFFSTYFLDCLVKSEKPPKRV